MYDGSRQHALLVYKFTGKERDSESGLDNFGARYDASSIGRFMSPDPDNAGASPDNPQSWNAYSYVLNNPLVFTDPNGLWCVWGDGTHDETPQNGGEDSVTCGLKGGYWDPGNYFLGYYEVKGGNLVGYDSPDSSGLFSPTQQVTVSADAPPLDPYGDPINGYFVKHVAPVATIVSGFTGMPAEYCGPISMESEKPEDSDHPKNQTQADKDVSNGEEVKNSRPRRPGPAANNNRGGAERGETAGALAEAAKLANNGFQCIANTRAQQH